MRIIKELEELSSAEKKLFYFTNVKPVLNRRALFADATAEYRNPPQPDVNEEVVFRFRTAKYNVDEVNIVINNITYTMVKVDNDSIFDFYEMKYTVGEGKIYYYFEVKSGKTVCYYNQIGVIKDLNPYYNFEIMPGFKVPEWAIGTVMYQIYIDRFYNGNCNNDVKDREYAYLGGYSAQVTDWNKYPAQDGVREFYGGDLQGVVDKLDYLKDLGIEAIYFNPLFVSPSNHKYDIQDYDYIDPHIAVIIDEKGEQLVEGDMDNTHASLYINRVTNRINLEASNAFFAKVVEEIHKAGMKVIIDGVFNHCGSFNKWLDKEKIYSTSDDEYASGAYIDENSRYHNFFKFYNDQWPYNNSYDGWWGHDTLPKLNYEGSKELEDYIIGIAKKWLSPPYNVDGWRLDVAADLGYSQDYNHSFWQRFRDEVKSVNPNAIIIAENYGDSNAWLQGKEWDTVMNYDAFMEPVTWFLTGMQKHSDEYREDMLGNADSFFGAMHHNMARLGGQSLAVAMNELSNHDHSRFLTRTNRTVGRVASKGSEAASFGISKAVMKEAVVIQMTWPGAPTIYYGDEAGVCGWTDPDNRRTYPWGHEDEELIAFHKAMINVHKESEALRHGSYKQLNAEYNLICYGRFTSDDVVIVVINNGDDERRARIPVWELGLTSNDDVEQVMMTTETGFGTEPLGYSLPGGMLDIGLRAKSAVVLRKIKQS